MGKDKAAIPVNNIAQPDIPNPTLQFSFKHLECDNSTYNLTQCPSEFWPLFAKELKRYTDWKIDDFTEQNNDDARHFVMLDDPRVDNTALEQVLNQFDWADAWQFGLGEKWEGKRVVGFLVESTFYIILLDANHQVYTKKEGGNQGW